MKEAMLKKRQSGEVVERPGVSQVCAHDRSGGTPKARSVLNHRQPHQEWGREDTRGAGLLVPERQSSPTE